VPGDRNARGASFSEEAVPHMDAVYRFALRLSESRDEAEDLVQDTYLRAYRAWEQYLPGTRCKSWLFTICRNVFLRRRERSQRHDAILLETAHDDPRAISREASVFAASRDEDPEGEFFRSIVDDQIVTAIEQLSEEYRLVVVLSDLEDLSYGEIAEVMEIPVGTVKSRLFRGRRQLQRWFYDCALEMGYISKGGDNWWHFSIR
jgi:RNA polymerase sigma-70 factor (ECF subfamily)